MTNPAGRECDTAAGNLSREERGNLAAAALAGAWRLTPPPLPLSAGELAQVTPLLLKTGAGALGWWRVRSSELLESPGAKQLHQAYRLYTILAAHHEGQLKQAVQILRSAGVEPLLAKGWAVGRLYPEPGLRPYGDIDLCVRSEQYPAAVTALTQLGVAALPVDLHRGSFHDLADWNLQELYHRSRGVNLDGVDIRILGPEDHLRLLSRHLLRHGAWRALGLCDIGLFLESLPREFDWDYLLSGDQRRSDWVACVLGLAHRLLGASLEEPRVAERANWLPSWLVPAVLRQWEIGHKYPMPMAGYLRHPVVGALQVLPRRWPNPIEATVRRHGPFNELPRLPFQIIEFLLRVARLPFQISQSLTLDDKSAAQRPR